MLERSAENLAENLPAVTTVRGSETGGTELKLDEPGLAEAESAKPGLGSWLDEIVIWAAPEVSA